MSCAPLLPFLPLPPLSLPFLVLSITSANCCFFVILNHWSILTLNSEYHSSKSLSTIVTSIAGGGSRLETPPSRNNRQIVSSSCISQINSHSAPQTPSSMGPDNLTFLTKPSMVLLATTNSSSNVNLQLVKAEVFEMEAFNSENNFFL